MTGIDTPQTRPPRTAEWLLFLAAIGLILAHAMLIGGCATTDPTLREKARDLAAQLRKQIDINHKCSQPLAGIPFEVWRDGQEAAKRAAKDLEQEVSR